MDLAYNPHAERARRKNRSSTNLHHLSLAPLTTKIPLADDEAATASALDTSFQLPAHRGTSYIQGKSAPTTPRLLSHSPAGARSRSRHRRTPSAPGVPVSKSKSTTYLAGEKRNGAQTPRRKGRDDLEMKDRSDSDWLLRTGALMSTEARESKGQAWLVSRQSSTSLAAMRDDDEEALEQELAQERELASRRASRRGSSAVGDDEVSIGGSRFASRAHSRSHSVAGLRSSNVLSPTAEGADSYFPDEAISGPDFVNLDEKLEELEQNTEQDDEAAVRRLVRYGQNGRGSWISNMIGWSLFSVEENDQDSDDGEDESVNDTASQATGRSRSSVRRLEGIYNVPEDRIPPPRKEEGAWGDASWLLSVATKVIF